MIIDQSEIDALLAEADNFAVEASAAVAVAGPAPAAAAAPLPALRRVKLPQDPNVHRILRLHVPVIVQLARRMMPIAAVRELSVGAIIEFEKSVEDRLDLCINNRLIGHGQCVKVGENFGLRVTEVCDKAGRVRAMGGR